MMQMPRREPLTEYVLRDPTGRPIGRVRAPAGGLRTGPGAETVLLIRCPASARKEVIATAA
jgi:hypothetical protein